MVLDNEWINSKEREYPIIIDPTITGVEESNSVIDTNIFDGDETITTYNQPYLCVGADKDNKIYRSLLKFNLPKIPAGYKVVDASVNLSCYPDEFGLAYLDKVPLISIHKITNDWNENTAKWNNMQNSFSNRIEDYYTANRMDSFHQEPGYEYIDQFKITNLVQQWYNGEPNYGIMLKEYKEAGTDQITFHYESVEKDMIVPIIEKIKSLGMKVGISIKPTDIPSNFAHQKLFCFLKVSATIVKTVKLSATICRESYWLWWLNNISRCRAFCTGPSQNLCLVSIHSRHQNCILIRL